MAELGRAQPVVAAAIGVLLTMNMSVLYVDRVGSESLAQHHRARITAAANDKPQGFVIFGKTDSAFGAPTVFAARADGSDLEPSSHPPRRIAQRTEKLANGAQGVLSHDRTRYATAGRDVWIIPAFGGEAKKLTNNVTPSDPGVPVWSPDDKYVAFVWRGNIVVMRADGSDAGVAYRAPTDVTKVEYLSLFGWTPSESTRSS